MGSSLRFHPCLTCCGISYKSSWIDFISETYGSHSHLSTISGFKSSHLRNYSSWDFLNSNFKAGWVLSVFYSGLNPRGLESNVRYLVLCSCSAGVRMVSKMTCINFQQKEMTLVIWNLPQSSDCLDVLGKLSESLSVFLDFSEGVARGLWANIAGLQPEYCPSAFQVCVPIPSKDWASWRSCCHFAWGGWDSVELSNLNWGEWGQRVVVLYTPVFTARTAQPQPWFPSQPPL